MYSVFFPTGFYSIFYNASRDSLYCFHKPLMGTIGKLGNYGVFSV